MGRHSGTLRRREFLASMVAAGAAAGVMGTPVRSLGAPNEPGLLAGEGVVDITPPVGIEMGGFHRPPGQERRIQGIRGPTAVRALVLQMGTTQVAICSLDVAAVSDAMSARVRSEVARQAGIPAENVRVAATHTHSMPGFCYLRQWGAIPKEFMALVERRTVEAVRRAKADLAPAEFALGKARVTGGNHNRTVKSCKTDEQFTKDSTDDERWLDTMLQALLFYRPGSKRTLLWYHFSAHAVCFADELAGPDWPGMVAELVRAGEKLDPSFLQGHCGDVNPGDGSDWRGEANQTIKAIYPALKQAIAAARPVPVDCLRTLRESFRMPLDMGLFKTWLERYKKDPKQCTGGEWVDAGFAEDWYRGNASRDVTDTHLPITMSALQLGPVAMLFHPSELYTCYGLAIRRDSPLAHTLVVGYTDGIIGYLADPKAYKAGEYAATTVPKILDYPPFTPNAARQFTAAATAMLRKVAGKS
jgi:hypothetical protein